MSAITAVLLATALGAVPQGQLRVVTSLTTYAAIAREIVGDRGVVTSIAEGDEDPHFVQPRPSFVPALRRADLFVTTGMDLELWVPALLDRAGNGRIREGAPGYVSAASGLPLLEVPAGATRAQGDIHVFGNPHVHTDPVNAVLIARNILAGLSRVAPADASYFTERTRDFERRVLAATWGEELVRVLTPATLLDLAVAGRLEDFLSRTQYQGRPLAALVGGWAGRAGAFRGRAMVCYHKEWSYLSRRFGVSCTEYIEPTPGVPPPPRHVQRVVARMRAERINVLFAAGFYDRRQIREVAERTGATAVMVPENTDGAPGVRTYFDLVETWIGALERAFASTGGVR